MGKILGIDLGTTNSAVAVWDGDGPKLIPGPGGARLTPSVVAFGARNEIFVGDAARHQAAGNPTQTVGSAKRFIGRRFEEVTEDREAVSYEVVSGKGGEALIAIGKKRWTPEAISARLLVELKNQAEVFLGEEVDGAVITVPAYFNDHQRTATREAGRLAGLDVRRIVNEPTAAALAYGLDKMHERERTVAVYDFGGGTFDVSILSVGEDIVEVIATHGDTHLGGDDIDARIAEWLREEVGGNDGLDEDAATHESLREVAEATKVALTTRKSVKVAFSVNAANPEKLTATLTLARFEEMIGDLVDRTLACCEKTLADARKRPDEIDEVVMVGGSSRIPLVQRRVSEYFGRELQSSVDPDEVVAFGAAVQAGILAGDIRGIVLVDVTSLSLGIELHDGRTAVVIPRNTTLPAEATRTFTTTGDGQESVQFHVVQGESGRAGANDSLGRFNLVGIADAPAGQPQLEVTFAIDINGVVQVSAVDRATGLGQSVTVAVTTGVASRRAPEGTPAASVATIEGAAAEDLGLASIPDATLDEAESLLEQAGETITASERTNIKKKSAQLLVLMEGGADPEQVERARLALRRLVTRVKRSIDGDEG